jgi:hypothetical protein
MWKALTLVLVAAALAAPVAQAQGSTDERAFQREIARTSLGVGERIAIQERGRAGDEQVVGRPDPAPLQVLGDPDRFDFVDAGIGGAFTLALALMTAAAVAVWNTSRRRTA